MSSQRLRTCVYIVLIIVCPFTDDIPGALLDLHVYLSNVFSQNADADQLHTANEADDTGHAGPAGDTFTDQCYDNGPYHANKTEGSNETAQPHNDSQRLNTQAGNSLKGQSQHFTKGIFAFTCQSLVALIVDTGAFEPHHGEHSTQEQIYFLEICEFLQDAAGNQPVIGVIVD